MKKCTDFYRMTFSFELSWVCLINKSVAEGIEHTYLALLLTAIMNSVQSRLRLSHCTTTSWSLRFPKISETRTHNLWEWDCVRATSLIIKIKCNYYQSYAIVNSQLRLIWRPRTFLFGFLYYEIWTFVPKIMILFEWWEFFFYFFLCCSCCFHYKNKPADRRPRYSRLFICFDKHTKHI